MAGPWKETPISKPQFVKKHRQHQQKNVGEIHQEKWAMSEEEEDEEDESSAQTSDCGSDSSESLLPRSKICQNLLPREWQKSQSRSTSNEADSFSETLSSSTPSAASQDEESHFKFFPAPSSTQFDKRRPPFMDSNAFAARPLHKSRQKHENSSIPRPGERNQMLGGSNGLSRHGGIIADRAADCEKVAAAGEKLRERLLDLAAAGDGGDVDMKLYQNLVEMFPLVETFMEHPEPRPRSNFQHHASMVYTRAPLRDAQVKKVANKVEGGRSSKNEGKANIREDAVWEESENRLRRVEPEESAWSPRADQIAKLQIQVEELHKKLAEKESMLQCKLAARNVSERADGNSKLMELERKLKELQCEMVEKELEWESAREKLLQKEDEISTMQQLLERAEGSHEDVRQRSAIREEEVNALRCEIAALRLQMEVADSMSELLEQTSCKAVTEEHQELEMEEMEAARKMYMAAIVAVKHRPGEECLALVSELRKQLQSFLRRTTFEGGVPLCC